MKTQLKILLLSFPLLVFSCTTKKEDDRFVIIEGKRQHIKESGTGQPTVVFVAGFGNDLSVYDRVQPEISLITRTVAYDRSGIGSSEIIDSTRTLDHMVKELNAILEQEDFEAPCILVGHSSGGHVVRYFASTYPEKVAGLLLIDPSVEYLTEEFGRTRSVKDVASFDSLYRYGRDPSWPEGMQYEANFHRRNEETMKRVKFPSDIPVTVLTAAGMQESSLPFLHGVNELKLTLHKRWVSESPQIKHIVTERSGHHIQLDEPNLVIGEIKTLIEHVRSQK